jgi:penicillin-binding protein 1A
VLYQRAGSGIGRVVAPLHVGEMNVMLSEAVTSGTGRQAALPGRPMAGKTGTTQDFKDAWFVGYTRQLVAGVWVGTDQGLTMGKDVTGGTLPAAVWRRFMERATAGQPVAPLPGVELVDMSVADDVDDVVAGVLKEQDGGSGQN